MNYSQRASQNRSARYKAEQDTYCASKMPEPILVGRFEVARISNGLREEEYKGPHCQKR